jgi:hypothetical protein
MNSSLGRNAPSKNLNSVCADLVTMAERELSAFFRAVTELFGTEQAELSAEDWLHEFTAIDSLPSSTRELRRIIIARRPRLGSPAE